MENNIQLKGLLRNIQTSHFVNDVEYNKAELVVQRKDGVEDVLNIKFKKFSNPYGENQEVELLGNVRSYSRRLEDGKSKVDIYVFTYFDKPTEDAVDEDNTIINNSVLIDGRICKMGELRTTTNGKHNIHFILANNILTDTMSKKINNYIPCVVWGKKAREFASLSVNAQVEIIGELHSREYKKTLPDGDVEIRVAHELVVNDFRVIDE